MPREDKRLSAGALITAGSFCSLCGILLGYTGLFTWSGALMLVGFAVAVVGGYLFLTGVVCWLFGRS